MDKLRDPRLLALLAGIISACGFAPLGLWPLTLAGLAGLIHLLGKAEGKRRSFAIGWWFGVGHFALSLNWVATAFRYQAEMPQWLGWLAVLLGGMLLALAPAICGLLTRIVDDLCFQQADAQASPAPVRAFTFAACWIITEWLKSWLLTGFAWNPLGAVMLDTPLAGWLPWIGSYALSGLVALIAGLLLAARQRPLSSGILALALVLAGWALMPAAPPPDQATRITLVQPNVPQEELNDPARFEAQFATLVRLSAPLAESAGKRRLVLWPESGIPDYLEDGYPQHYYDGMTFEGDPVAARARIAQAIGAGSVLLTGAVNLEIADGRAVAARNSVLLLDDRGVIAGRYDKAHLVPFGEYLPLRALLEPLGASRLVAGSIDFRHGAGPRSLAPKAGWPKAGMQICYEIVFSGQVVDRKHRPAFIFNPTNDGWFGSWGPPQHLAQARMRALEEGLPVLRATTNGISAVIAADGSIVEQIGEDEAGRIDLPLPGSRPPGWFARAGNMLCLMLAALFLLPAFIIWRSKSGIANSPMRG